MHLWQRPFQKRTFHGPKTVALGFHYSCLVDRKLNICLSGFFSQRTLLLWGSWRITGASHYHNGAPAEILHQLDCPGILKVIKHWPEKIFEYHQRRWPILKRTHCVINYQKTRRNMPYLLIVLPHCRKGSEIKSPTKNCWRRRWLKWVCRGEGHPAGFRHCWIRKMTNILVLYWLVWWQMPCGVVAVMAAKR